MKTKKSNILLNKRLWVALLAATLICIAFSFTALAENTIDISPTSQNRIIFLGDRPEGINKEYEIKDKASLVEADLALLRWNAMGKDADNSNDKIIGVFGENGEEKVIYYGYWNVYEQVYQRLLNAEGVITKSTTNEITLGDAPSGGTMIVKFTKGGRTSITAKLKNLSTVKGKLIILAEDAAELLTSEYSTYCRFSIESGGTLVIQGPRDKKITLSDKANQAAKRTQKSFIDVAEGNLYLSNCVLQNYTFNGLYKSTICFPSSNTERHLYMANSTMQNVTARNTNNSTYGCETGGILCMVYGGDDNSKADDSTLYINKCTFSQCNINSTGTVGGGAIRSYVADQCDLFVYNSTFSNNNCDYDGRYTSGGGAIYWKSADGEATLSGCTFSGNYAAKVGGAIYNTGKMTIIGCEFNGNTAGDSGGAIAVEPPNTSTSYNISPTSGSLELDSTTIIENNTATNRGGGIYFNAVASKIGTTDIEIFEMTLTINGAQIKNNSAKEGGGVAMWLNYNDYTYATGISIESTSEITGNHASEEGGAIWMSSADSCKCNGNSGVTMESGTMSQNYAPSGGAVYIGAGTSATNMEFKMQGGTVSGNGVNANGETTVNGGAIYMTSGKCTISGGSIENCKATANGGAICMTSGTCTISGGTIDNCKATGDGGGVYLGGGTFALNYNLSAATISNCSAGNNGGGVYLGAGTMTINGGIITNNTAQNGGGAYVNATNANDGILVTGGEISQNIATNGGGLAVNNGVYKMSGGNIHNNTANNLGGAIYVSATTDVEVDIRSGIIENNYAAVSGGALGVEGLDDGVEFTITIGINQAHYDSNGNEIQCDHDFNVAGDVNPESDTGIYDCPVIKNNTALKTGGGIYITGSENAMLYVYCLEEEGNKAADGKLNDQGKPDTSKPTKSDFMMVNGGTVTLTTADQADAGPGLDNGTNGNIVINGSIHVKAGKMTLDGSISNPLINGEITVDVAKKEDFNDYRHSGDNPEYHTIQYFENFLNEDTGEKSGQYTVFLVKHGDKHTILPALYTREGYMIDGWWDNEDATGNGEYPVNESFVITDNLKLWAKWLRVGYWVYFDSGTDSTTSGSMERQRFDYITAETPESAFINLNENTFSRVGYVFDGWSKTLGGPRVYTDQQQIRANITTERTVTLYACWILCTHNDNVNAVFTYSESDIGNAIIRTCSCQACTQTATLTAENGVYDGTTSYSAKVTVVADSQNGKAPEAWNISDTDISYSATKIGDNEKSITANCINAGDYTASITVENKTAQVTYIIDKAKQDLPNKPEYVAEVRNGSSEKRIYITLTTDETLKNKLQYYIKWYKNEGEKLSEVKDYSYATTTGFELNQDYTYYYVYVQYKGDDNHYESDWVMADAVLFHEGDISIKVITGEGIVFTSTLAVEPRQLSIKVTSSEKYHLFDTKYQLSVPDGASPLTITPTNDNSTITNNTITYVVGNIPNNVASLTEYIITISGTKLKVVTTSAITASEEFGTVSGTEATITRDSAYTAYFEVKNYDSKVYTNPTLSFDKQLPTGATVILIDKSNGANYYSYTASGTEKAIPLEWFVQMGTENTTFTAPDTSLSQPLKYQVVVDFSDCAEWITGSITTSLTDFVSVDAQNKGAPDFPTVTCQTTLTEPESHSLTLKTKNGTAITLEIEYPRASVNSSKWNNRAVALVLTTIDTLPVDTLPVDARFDVTDGVSNATHYRNANGEFIIPLKDFDVSNLTLTLVSNLFPASGQSYEFNVKLMYSDSLSGKSPSNGIVLVSSSSINFVAAASTEPAIKIVDNLQTIYAYNSTITVSVKAQNLPKDTKLILRLYNKTSDKGWVDTALKLPVNKEESGEGYLPTEVSLGNLTGSCYIVLELIDSFDEVITSDKYYFIISDN